MPRSNLGALLALVLLMPSLRLLLALAFLATSCGGDDDAPAADATVTVDAALDPQFDTIRGSFRIIEGEFRSDEGTSKFGRASGSIADAVAPMFHTETMRVGSCRLLEFELASCDPFCNGICVDTNVCAPWPTYISAGTITVSGLKTSMTLTPEAGFNWYNPATFPVPDDLFDPGATITASAAGADVGAFTLTAAGVETLVPGFSDHNLTVPNGADFELTWTPDNRGARVRLTLNSPNAAHGMPYHAIIECDGPDTGALTIPRAIIESFPETIGYAICVSIDCPLSSMMRYTRDTADLGDGDVELIVTSDVQFGIVHPMP